MMRQKFGVALAVVALALSGAREASRQFHQLASLAGGWADAGVWGNLLVHAVGTFEGLAATGRQPAPLIASDTSACEDSKAAHTRRAARANNRNRAAHAKGAAVDSNLRVEELALGFAESGGETGNVGEFKIEVRREVGATTGGLGREFFRVTEAHESAGAEIAHARLESELAKLGGADFVLRLVRADAAGRSAVVKTRIAPGAHGAGQQRRRIETRRDEEPADEGDADETSFQMPSASSGLVGCDEPPRR